MTGFRVVCFWRPSGLLGLNRPDAVEIPQTGVVEPDIVPTRHSTGEDGFPRRWGTERGATFHLVKACGFARPGERVMSAVASEAGDVQVVIAISRAGVRLPFQPVVLAVAIRIVGGGLTEVAETGQLPKIGQPVGIGVVAAAPRDFKCPDIAAITAGGIGEIGIVHRPAEAALIRVAGQRRDSIALAFVNGRATHPQRVGGGQPTVALQRAELRIGVDLIAGRDQEAAPAITAQVVAGGQDRAVKAVNVFARNATAENRVADLHYRGPGITLVEDAAAKHGRVAAKGAGVDREVRVARIITHIVDAAAALLRAGGVAADGAGVDR